LQVYFFDIGSHKKNAGEDAAPRRGRLKVDSLRVAQDHKACTRHATRSLAYPANRYVCAVKLRRLRRRTRRRYTRYLGVLLGFGLMRLFSLNLACGAGDLWMVQPFKAASPIDPQGGFI